MQRRNCSNIMRCLLDLLSGGSTTLERAEKSRARIWPSSAAEIRRLSPASYQGTILQAAEKLLPAPDSYQGAASAAPQAIDNDLEL